MKNALQIHLEGGIASIWNQKKGQIPYLFRLILKRINRILQVLVDL